MSMWSLDFWKASAERAISTGAQSALVLMGTDITGYLALEWDKIAVISGISAIASLIKSVAVAGASDGSPSLGSFEKLK